MVGRGQIDGVDEIRRTRRHGRLKWYVCGPGRGRECTRVCRMKLTRRVVGGRSEIDERGRGGGQGVDLL